MSKRFSDENLNHKELPGSRHLHDGHYKKRGIYIFLNDPIEGELSPIFNFRSFLFLSEK